MSKNPKVNKAYALEGLIEVYETLAPDAKNISDLNRSLAIMRAESKPLEKQLKFVSACIHFGLVLNKW